MAELRTILLTDFPVVIDHAFAKSLRRMVIAFEVRGDHPKAFNTPLLGVDRARFTQTDVENLFNLAGVDREAFRRVCHRDPDVNPDHKVVSNPFNIFCVWLAHLAMVSEHLSKHEREDVAWWLMLYMNYSFFTSAVWNAYPHGASRDVMMLTIERMNARFDLKKSDGPSTWGEILKNQATDTVTEGGIHSSALMTFAPTQKVLYIISAAKTRLNRRIVAVNRLFYELHAKGEQLGDRSLLATVEGETIIKAILSHSDQIRSGLVSAATQPNTFIRSEDLSSISIIVGLKQPELLRRVLALFSAMAAEQLKLGTQDELIVPDSTKPTETIAVGYRALLHRLFDNTFGAIGRDQELQLTDRADIVVRTMRIYRNSQVADVGIKQTKLDIEHLLDRMNVTRRSETLSSLKITLITYLVRLGLRYV